jgi:hypothetical protein
MSQNYTSPSSTAKAEAIVKDMKTINPTATVGAFRADVSVHPLLISFWKTTYTLAAVLRILALIH